MYNFELFDVLYNSNNIPALHYLSMLIATIENDVSMHPITIFQFQNGIGERTIIETQSDIERVLRQRYPNAMIGTII